MLAHVVYSRVPCPAACPCLSPGLISRRKQPQLLVLPSFKCLPATRTSLPQSHRQRNAACMADPTRLSPSRRRTVRRPNFWLVRSIDVTATTDPLRYCPLVSGSILTNTSRFVRRELDRDFANALAVHRPMIRPPKCRPLRVEMLDVLIALAGVTSVVRVRPRGVCSPPPCAAAYFLIPDKPGRGRLCEN